MRMLIIGGRIWIIALRLTAGSVVRTVLALHNLVKNRLELKEKSEKAEEERQKKAQKDESLKTPDNKDKEASENDPSSKSSEK